MQYFRVRNLEKFQAYKDGRPIQWIKLYINLLEHPEFSFLSDSEKWHAIGIWLLAARCGNKLLNDPKWIAKKIDADRTVDLEKLFKLKFIEPYEQNEGSVEIRTESYGDPKEFVRSSNKSREEREKSREETETDARTREGWFEELWSKYPKKDGRKEALRRFKATVETEEDHQKINKALTNYLNCKKVRAGYIKDGSTWFNNWEDWVDYVEILPRGEPTGMEAIKALRAERLAEEAATTAERTLSETDNF